MLDCNSPSPTPTRSLPITDPGFCLHFISRFLDSAQWQSQKWTKQYILVSNYKSCNLLAFHSFMHVCIFDKVYILRSKEYFVQINIDFSFLFKLAYKSFASIAEVVQWFSDNYVFWVIYIILCYCYKQKDKLENMLHFKTLICLSST